MFILWTVKQHYRLHVCGFPWKPLPVTPRKAVCWSLSLFSFWWCPPLSSSTSWSHSHSLHSHSLVLFFKDKWFGRLKEGVGFKRFKHQIWRFCRFWRFKKRRAKPFAGSKMFQDRFCGVYTSLAEDIKGHARLARGEIIIETFKSVNLAIDLNLFKSLDSCICSGSSKEEKQISWLSAAKGRQHLTRTWQNKHYFTLSDPHHGISRRIFGHSIWHLFWHPIWHPLWHSFQLGKWTHVCCILLTAIAKQHQQESKLIFCHTLWQSVWHMYLAEKHRDLALAAEVQQNHSDHVKYLWVEMQLPSCINKKVTSYTLKLMTFNLAYGSGISSDIVWSLAFAGLAVQVGWGPLRPWACSCDPVEEKEEEAASWDKIYQPSPDRWGIKETKRREMKRARQPLAETYSTAPHPPQEAL